MKQHRAFKSFLALRAMAPLMAPALVLIATNAGECFAQDGTPKPAPAAMVLPPLDKDDPFRDVPRPDPAYTDLKSVSKPLFPSVSGYPTLNINSPEFDRRLLTRYEFAVYIDRALRYIKAMPEDRLCALLRQHPDFLPALTRLLATFERELRTLGVDFEAAKANLSAKVKAAKAGVPFTDVSPGHWAFASVERLRQEGIVIGYNSDPVRTPRPFRGQPVGADQRNEKGE